MNKKMNEQQVDKMLRIGAEFFGSFNDPTEIRWTRENYEKILSLHPSAYTSKTNEDGDLIAWTVIVPTSQVLANDFIERRITEAELLDKTDRNEVHGALYLEAAFTLPEYRGKGYIKEMYLEQIREMTGNKPEEFLLFAWPVTKEGEAVVNALSRDLGMGITLRKKKERTIERDDT